MMTHLLGLPVLFILKDGNDVLFKVMQEKPYSLHGYDEEGQNTSVMKSDIVDYVIR